MLDPEAHSGTRGSVDGYVFLQTSQIAVSRSDVPDVGGSDEVVKDVEFRLPVPNLYNLSHCFLPRGHSQKSRFLSDPGRAVPKSGDFSPADPPHSCGGKSGAIQSGSSSSVLVDGNSPRSNARSLGPNLISNTCKHRRPSPVFDDRAANGNGRDRVSPRLGQARGRT